MTEPIESASTASESPMFAPATEAGALEEVRDWADTVWTRGPENAPAVGRVGTHSVEGVGGRVAIVDGCRTPFCKSGTDLRDMDVVDLSGVVASELVTRSGVDPEDIGLSIWGVVVPALHAPNLGREVVFRASLPMQIPGTTVNLACASSNRAITSAAEALLTGQCSVALAGGAESLTNVPIQVSKSGARKLIALSKARSARRKLGVVASVRPKDLIPVPPAIAEYTTGMSMGQACEKMAKENDISRRAQDEIALMSHDRATAAAAEGRFAGQIVPVFPKPKRDRAVVSDNGVRADSSMEALGGLRPVFDKHYGTLTAGNSSPLTDGAAGVILMQEEKAKAEGFEPLGYIRSWAYASLDPGSQLLQGPAYAAPLALERAGMKLSDMDLVEMHEAFAAQIISNMKAYASRKFARDELGSSEPMGEVDFDSFNVNGGSISIGHPFGATGARVTMQLLNELKRRDLNLGLMTVCAAGGVGFAMVVERQ
ncbi:MAG: acetyl-CoA C-acyltransferase FadI [Thermoanaerobaculia bacterium]